MLTADEFIRILNDELYIAHREPERFRDVERGMSTIRNDIIELISEHMNLSSENQIVRRVINYQNETVDNVRLVIVRYMSAMLEYDDEMFHNNVDLCLGCVLEKYTLSELEFIVPLLLIEDPFQHNGGRRRLDIELFREEEEYEDDRVDPPVQVEMIPETQRTEIECPICYETIIAENVMRTQCNHSFCQDCLCTTIDSVNVMRSPECPMCREQITLIRTSNDLQYADMTAFYGIFPIIT